MIYESGFIDSKYKITSKNSKGNNHNVTKKALKRLKPTQLPPENGVKKMKIKHNNENNEKIKTNGTNNTNVHKILQTQRRSLPVFRCRNRLLDEIRRRETLIILGETGSGKTTQIPQYIHSVRLQNDGRIAVTQPRRVAAISIAQRVALEAQTTVGEIVGYSVRFEDCTSPLTKIKFMTDGMLLREALSDNLLSAYTVVVLDEAHERTIHTDVLFGIVKQAQKSRKVKGLAPLKIIIMSATMDVDHFSKYFNNAPVVYLDGRTFPVTINHTVKPHEDYVHTCLITIFQLHRNTPANEDILVFLTGKEEIESLAHSVRMVANSSEQKITLKVYPLYAGLPSQQQLEVFRPTVPGARKVVISTNVAETSLTISGIKHVIDSGMVKVRTYIPATGFEVLRIQRISQEQAWQRTGRAGRESEGFCHRLYTKQQFNSLARTTIPEIQRCNLGSVLLQLLALGIDVLKFDWMDRPNPDAITSALLQLHQLGAVNSDNELTDMGRKMSLFPLDPKYSRMIICAKDYNCLEEILTIVALLSCDSIYFTPIANKKEAAAKHEKFMSNLGDHISLLNIFRAFNGSKEKKGWCKENYFVMRNLKYAKEVRRQLADVCERCGLERSTAGSNTNQIRKCLLSGLFMNVAQLQQGSKEYVTVDSKTKVQIHPSSTLRGVWPDTVVYSEIVMTGKCYLRTVTTMQPDWLEEVAPEYERSHHIARWAQSGQKTVTIC